MTSFKSSEVFEGENKLDCPVIFESNKVHELKKTSYDMSVSKSHSQNASNIERISRGGTNRQVKVQVKYQRVSNDRTYFVEMYVEKAVRAAHYSKFESSNGIDTHVNLNISHISSSCKTVIKCFEPKKDSNELNAEKMFQENKRQKDEKEKIKEIEKKEFKKLIKYIKKKVEYLINKNEYKNIKNKLLDIVNNETKLKEICTFLKCKDKNDAGRVLTHLIEICTWTLFD